MADAAVVSIGTFDGVHLGHQAILTEVRRQAEQRRLTSVTYAFGMPPRLHDENDRGRCLLLPESAKVRALLRTVDRVVRASLPEVRSLSPDEFAARVLREALHAESVVVGPSFRFGAQRVGNPDTLRSLGVRLGFSVTVVPPVLIDGGPVNSTRIRSLLADGRIREATALLGRPPILFGDVTRGDRVGRTLGYPTANLSIEPHVLLPERAVYVGRAFLGRMPVPAARPGLLYVGTRPTLGGKAQRLRCEIHLLTPPETELYGERIEVHLLERLREDRTFPSLDDLRLQIARDAERATEVLARFPELLSPIGG